MRCFLILSGILLSLNCFSQALSKQEQTKVDNTLNSIKSITEIGDTCANKKSSNIIRFRITPTSVDSSKLPLVIIDGVLHSYGALQLLDPNSIETLSVMKTERDLSFFCSRPTRDTIIITLKPKITL